MRALSDVLSLMALAGYLLSRGIGCATVPSDALRSAIELNNLAVAGLEAARADHTARLVAAYQAREAHCPPLPDAARLLCRQQAQADTLEEYGQEASRLDLLVLLEHLAADHLAAAAQCRRDGLSCEAGKLRDAEAPLAQVRAGLAR